METFLLTLVALLAAVAVTEERTMGGSGEENRPTITTKETIYRVQAGEDVELECSVEDLGPLVLLWKQGNRVLYAGELRVRRDSRLELSENSSNLRIRRIEPGDQGEYECEVEEDRGLEPVSIKHRVEVLVPPAIISTRPADGQHLTVKQGSRVRLECSATGNPTPRVSWGKVNEATILGEGGVLQLDNITRYQEGTYECTARNGVGSPAKTQISVQVLYKPEVIAEVEVVYSGVGRAATLSCRVYSAPEAEVKWYRGTMLMEADNIRYMDRAGTRYSLILHHVDSADFAAYSCQATNKIGSATASLQLAGTPQPPRLASRVEFQGRGSYRVSWSTESYAPITQYILLYRKVPDTRSPDKISAWTNILISGDTTGGGSDKDFYTSSSSLQHTFTASFLLSMLEDRAEYEVKVRAKNEFGTSEMSESFQFHTNSAETMVVESLRKEVATGKGGLTQPSCFLLIPQVLVALLSIRPCGSSSY